MKKIRSEGFGVNVKRRIALGNFVLSTQDVDYNQMFLKAQQIRRLFCHEYTTAMNKVDIMISPNAVGDTPTVESIKSGKNWSNRWRVFDGLFYSSFKCIRDSCYIREVIERLIRFNFLIT